MIKEKAIPALKKVLGRQSEITIFENRISIKNASEIASLALADRVRVSSLPFLDDHGRYFITLHDLDGYQSYHFDFMGLPNNGEYLDGVVPCGSGEVGFGRA